MEDPNFVVQLFIRTLQIKHKLTFEKDKEEYFKVLFDTYLKGQGNPDELKDYIAAGVQNPDVINIIANQIVEWQTKAADLKKAEQAMKDEKEKEKQKINQFVAARTKKLKEEAEREKKEKGEEAPRKKHKRQQPAVPEAPSVEGKQGVAPEGTEGVEPVEGAPEGAQQSEAVRKGLKQQLQQKGKEKCKFYPYCKNLETCQFFHPSQRCTFFPNCRYGDACLYEHEACRFKEKCTRPNCAYSHPFKKTNPIQEMMKTFMSKNNPLSRGGKKKPFNKHKPEQKDQKQQKEQPKQQQPQE